MIVWLIPLLLTSALADEARFHDAMSRFKRLDYEGCVADLDQLLAQSRPDGERTTLLLYSGAARALLGDDGGARLAFESAVRIDSSVTLTFKTSPKVTALFDEVRKAVAASKREHDPPSSGAAESAPVPPSTSSAVPSSATPSSAMPSSAVSSTSSSSATPPSSPPSHDDAPTHEPRTVPPTKPPATSTQESAGPSAGALVGIASSVATIGALGVGAFYGADVMSKLSLANDKATSQVRAQELVGGANQSLVVASVLAGTGVATAVVAVVAFAWQ